MRLSSLMMMRFWGYGKLVHNAGMGTGREEKKAWSVDIRQLLLKKIQYFPPPKNLNAGSNLRSPIPDDGRERLEIAVKPLSTVTVLEVIEY